MREQITENVPQKGLALKILYIAKKTTLKTSIPNYSWFQLDDWVFQGRMVENEDTWRQGTTLEGIKRVQTKKVCKRHWPNKYSGGRINRFWYHLYKVGLREWEEIMLQFPSLAIMGYSLF